VKEGSESSFDWTGQFEKRSITRLSPESLHGTSKERSRLISPAWEREVGVVRSYWPLAGEIWPWDP